LIERVKVEQHISEGTYKFKALRFWGKVRRQKSLV
jgi:hypothetical protein